MAKNKNKNKDGALPNEEKPDIYLEFMGTRLKVNEENGGSVDESEIPYVKGASLKFTGCDGDVRFAEVKVLDYLFSFETFLNKTFFRCFLQAPLKDRFERPPYIKYSRGDDFGIVGFDKCLSEEDISFVREHLKTINNQEVSWELLDGLSFFTVCHLFAITTSYFRGNGESLPN